MSPIRRNRPKNSALHVGHTTGNAADDKLNREIVERLNRLEGMARSLEQMARETIKEVEDIGEAIDPTILKNELGQPVFNEDGNKVRIGA